MYAKARNKVKETLRKERRAFEIDVALQSKHNSKKFWAYSKKKLKTKTGIAPLRSDKDDPESICFSASDKAEILQRQFLSVLVHEPADDVPDPGYNVEECVENIDISSASVKKKLDDLKPGKSPGPDELHPLMLKELSQYITEPLTVLFRKSIASSILPAEWKTAYVSPLFKKGSKQLA